MPNNTGKAIWPLVGRSRKDCTDSVLCSMYCAVWYIHSLSVKAEMRKKYCYKKEIQRGIKEEKLWRRFQSILRKASDKSSDKNVVKRLKIRFKNDRRNNNNNKKKKKKKKKKYRKVEKLIKLEQWKIH